MSESNEPASFFDAEVYLRWGDMDSLGHVNNVTHLRLLEEGRSRFFSQLGYHDEVDFGMVTGRHEVDYRKPLYYSLEPVTVRCSVARLGTSAFTLRCQTRDQNGEPVVDSLTVIIITTLDGAASQPIPDRVRQALLPYLSEG